MKIFVLLTWLLTSTVSAAENSESIIKNDSWEDFKTSFNLMFKGSYMQFTQKNNLYYMGAAVPTLWYTFEHDRRLSSLYRSKKLRSHVDLVGEIGVPLNFPILQAGLYYTGRAYGNEKLVAFAMEYFATMYLTLVETGLLSYVQVHHRPSSHDISFWEKEFRGDSSWPSGHIVPYTALFFKTFQYYGPWWSLGPLVLSYWASKQRVQDGKHWVSDVVGSFFLTAFASEGVRAAAGFNHNDPFYDEYLSHNVQIGIIRKDSGWGPRVSWTF
jgi:undecaprenyl-diphosphatase